MENAGKITTYKGFNGDFTCRGFQYEVGGTYHTDEVQACYTGFHACKNPLDVLRYYSMYDSRYALVEQSGILDHSSEDTKLASSDIYVKKEIDISQLCNDGIQYILDLCRTGNPSSNQTTYEDTIFGYGRNSAWSSLGTSIITKGSYNNSVAMCEQKILHTSGFYNNLAIAGNKNTVTSSGDVTVVTVKGALNHIGIAGIENTSIVIGPCNLISVSGRSNKIMCAGEQIRATSSGPSSILDVHGTGSIAMAAGLNCIASAGEKGAFALAWMDRDQVRIAVGIVGENGIKPDVLYKVGPNGVLVEAQI